jgi:O-antigen/teichoic acid export membrane protein
MALARVVGVFTGPVALILVMTGHEGPATRGLLVAAVLNVALGLALVPHHGAFGAALAFAASILASGLVLGRKLYRCTGFVCTALPARRLGITGR